jgi:O-antigen ligase
MPERSSLASRIIIWEVSLHLLREHPWLGIGPGNFQQSYLNAQLFFPPYLEWAVPHPHQLYLAFWLESGLLGLIGFLFIIHYTLMRLWRASKEKTSGMLPMLLLSLLTALLLQGFFDTPYFSLPLAYLFWCILLLL